MVVVEMASLPRLSDPLPRCAAAAEHQIEARRFMSGITFGKLWDPVDVDVAYWTKSASETMEKVDEALSSAPALMVVHLLGIDRVGHAKGWQSQAYLHAVSRVDGQVGALLALLEAKSLRQNTLIIIASDHGGIGKKHGGDTPTERLTPVILNGPSLKEGLVIETETANVDLFFDHSACPSTADFRSCGGADSSRNIRSRPLKVVSVLLFTRCG